MDNITHSLLGSTLAEGALAFGGARPVPPERARVVRILFHAVSVLANNLPDADLFVTWLTPGTLGYLLHHRGHTHLLLAVIPLGLVALGLAALGGLLLRTPSLPRSVWVWAAGLGFAGIAAHVGADFLNSYGVHPFWPFWNGWLYGDAVFIIEPLLWTILGTYLAVRIRSWVFRTALCVLLVGIVALGLHLGLLGTFSLVTLVAVGLVNVAAVTSCALFARGSKAAPVFPFLAVLLLASAVVSVFLWGSRSAKAHVREWIRAGTGGASLVHDVVVDPLPSHFLCWQFLSVEEAPSLPSPEEDSRSAEGGGGPVGNPLHGGAAAGGRYLVRSGRVAIAPAWVDLGRCPKRSGEGFPLAVSSLGGSPHIDPLGEWGEPLDALRARAADCRVSAWLRFARVPVFEGRRGHDLRYSRNERESFASLDAEGAGESDCPRNLPNWLPPRADVFGSSLLFP